MTSDYFKYFVRLDRSMYKIPEQCGPASTSVALADSYKIKIHKRNLVETAPNIQDKHVLALIALKAMGGSVDCEQIISPNRIQPGLFINHSMSLRDLICTGWVDLVLGRPSKWILTELGYMILDKSFEVVDYITKMADMVYNLELFLSAGHTLVLPSVSVGKYIWACKDGICAVDLSGAIICEFKTYTDASLWTHNNHYEELKERFYRDFVDVPGVKVP